MLAMKAVATFLMSCVFGASVFGGVENFDKVKTGELPKGWSCGITGDGKADWQVVEEADAPSGPNVLKQSGTAKYCWCVNTNLAVKNGRLLVKIKPISGREDEAGGLIWRFQDANNYYVARANAAENNVTIYKTVGGVRKEYGRTTMSVAPRRWHTLQVEFNGPHFTVLFDGEFALAWDDDEFTNAGPAGVWTKADSVTEFDDFRWENDGDR